jgi:hypothetical protein
MKKVRLRWRLDFDQLISHHCSASVLKAQNGDEHATIAWAFKWKANHLRYCKIITLGNRPSSSRHSAQANLQVDRYNSIKLVDISKPAQYCR